MTSYVLAFWAMGFASSVSERCNPGLNCYLAALGSGERLAAACWQYATSHNLFCFCTMKHLVYTALPICAHTPAPTALIIKIAVRPAIVIVVTPSSLEKTARSPGEDNRPTLTTTVTLTSAQAFAQTSTVIAQTSLLTVIYKFGRWADF